MAGPFEHEDDLGGIVVGEEPGDGLFDAGYRKRGSPISGGLRRIAAAMVAMTPTLTRLTST